MLFPFQSADPTNPVLTPGLSIAQQVTKVNNAWLRDYNAIALLAANYILLNKTYLGAGRFVGATIDPDKEPTAGTGLTVRVMNDTYMVDGRAYLINNPEPSPYQVVTGILANKPDGVEVFAGISPTTGLLVTDPDWQFDDFPTTEEDLATIAGLLHLGRAETSATAVTDFTPSTVDNRGIIRPPGTGGGGGGGITQEQLDAAIASLRSYFLGRLAELEAQIIPGTRPVAQPIDNVYHKLQILRSELATSQETIRWICEELLDAGQLTALADAGLTNRPQVIERDQSATIGPNYGSGENSTPDFDGDGVSKNDDGSFGV